MSPKSAALPLRVTLDDAETLRFWCDHFQTDEAELRQVLRLVAPVPDEVAELIETRATERHKSR